MPPGLCIADLFAACKRANFNPANALRKIPGARQHRLELARRAFKEIDIQSFWSWQENPRITEETIPLVVRALRFQGGKKGCELAAELFC